MANRAAADARAAAVAVGGDLAALDVDAGGVLALAAADARAAAVAVGGDGAALDGDIQIRGIGMGAAADARGLGAAGGVDHAGDDIDLVHVAAAAGADARAALFAVAAAGGLNVAAVDLNAAGLRFLVAADTRVAAGGPGDQLTHPAAEGLDPDAEYRAVLDLDALVGREGCVVAQDQVDGAFNGHALIEGYAFVDHVPVVIHILLRDRLGIGLRQQAK